MRWVICGNAVRAKVSVPDVDHIHTTVTKQGDIMIEHDQNAELRLVHELYSTMQLIQQLCILQPECRPSNSVPVAVTLCQHQTSWQCNHACTCGWTDIESCAHRKLEPMRLRICRLCVSSR